MVRSFRLNGRRHYGTGFTRQRHNDSGSASVARQAMRSIAERGAIQDSQESLKVLAARDGINPKTVQKWKKRDSREGPTGVELKTRIELKENHKAFAAMGFRKLRESSHPVYDRPTSITMRLDL